MICDTCGNQDAYHLRSYFLKGHTQGWCDRCDPRRPSSIPDVFWPGHGYYSDALDVDFTSPRQKAAYLNEQGIREAGDRNSQPDKTWVEGTRSYRQKQFEKERPALRQLQKQYLDNVRRRGP